MSRKLIKKIDKQDRPDFLLLLEMHGGGSTKRNKILFNIYNMKIKPIVVGT